MKTHILGLKKRSKIVSIFLNTKYRIILYFVKLSTITAWSIRPIPSNTNYITTPAYNSRNIMYISVDIVTKRHWKLHWNFSRFASNLSNLQIRLYIIFIRYFYKNCYYRLNEIVEVIILYCVTSWMLTVYLFIHSFSPV